MEMEGHTVKSDLDAVAIICSTGRPQILHETLISMQGLEPGLSCVYVSVAADSDVLEKSLALPGVKCLIAPRGAAAQRNAALRALRSTPEIIFFFDDDIEVAPNHVQAYTDCFRSDENIMLATAVDLRPRITDIAREDAKLIISSVCSSNPETDLYRDFRTAYGASMAVRGTLLGKVWFDENLPLYSFLEDYDFALSCRAFGRCVLVRSAKYVHLETSSGRVSNTRRGYSEVVNPFYIARKHGIGLRPRLILGCLQRTARSITVRHDSEATSKDGRMYYSDTRIHVKFSNCGNGSVQHCQHVVQLQKKRPSAPGHPAFPYSGVPCRLGHKPWTL